MVNNDRSKPDYAYLQVFCALLSLDVAKVWEVSEVIYLLSNTAWHMQLPYLTWHAYAHIAFLSTHCLP